MIDLKKLRYPPEKERMFLSLLLRKNGKCPRVPSWFRRSGDWWGIMRDVSQSLSPVVRIEELLSSWEHWGRLVNDLSGFDTSRDFSSGLRDWEDDIKEGLNMEWVWRDWIANGIYTLLVGYGKVGKSYVLLELVRRMMLGEEMPDGQLPSVGMKGKKVLWMDTERSMGFNPQRAKKLGVPLKNMIYPFRELRIPRLDREEDQIEIESVAELPEVGLVVLDSFSMSHSLRENDSEVGKISGWLSQLASDTGKPVIALHHLRKPGRESMRSGEISSADVRGHGSIIQTARTIMGVDIPDIANKNMRRLRVLEGNMGNNGPPIGFTVDDDGVHFCEAPEVRREEKLIDLAVEFLRDALKGSAVLAIDVKEMAEELGITPATLRRADKELEVVKVRKNGKSYWSLPCTKYGEGDEG